MSFRESQTFRLSLAYTFAHLWPEIFPIILSFTLGLPHGLSPLQILSVDLASEMPPAVSLAYEQPEQDIMHTKPRSRLKFFPLQICILHIFSMLFYVSEKSFHFIKAFICSLIEWLNEIRSEHPDSFRRVSWPMPTSSQEWQLQSAAWLPICLFIGTTISRSETFSSLLNITGRSEPRISRRAT